MTKQTEGTTQSKSFWKLLVAQFKSAPSLWDRAWIAILIASTVSAASYFFEGHTLTHTEWLIAVTIGVGASIGWLLHDILGVLRSILKGLKSG
jgi:hypothetical protein